MVMATRVYSTLGKSPTNSGYISGLATNPHTWEPQVRMRNPGRARGQLEVARPLYAALDWG
eukprot:9441614-Lingulodinium_polyedra.AAC.1